MSLISEEDDVDSLNGRPLYYQGKFVPNQSMSASSGGLSMRPSVYGTLAAADAGARGSFQMPGGYSSDGASWMGIGGPVLNLPRYYPKYETLSRARPGSDGATRWNGFPTSAGAATDTWRRSLGRSSEHSIPFYRDDPYLESTEDGGGEPVYTKPKKLSKRRVGETDFDREIEAAVPAANGASASAANGDRQQWLHHGSKKTETFTVVDGADPAQAPTEHPRGRQRCGLIASVIVGVVLFLVLVAIAIFLGIYLTQKSPNSAAMPVMPVYSVYPVLRINVPYMQYYDNLTDNNTVLLTNKLCNIFSSLFSTVTTASGVASWSNNCTAYNYLRGSIINIHRLAFTVSPGTNHSDLVTSVNSTLWTVCHVTTQGVFFQAFRAQVDLITVALSPAGVTFTTMMTTTTTQAAAVTSTSYDTVPWPTADSNVASVGRETAVDWVTTAARDSTSTSTATTETTTISASRNIISAAAANAAAANTTTSPSTSSSSSSRRTVGVLTSNLTTSATLTYVTAGNVTSFSDRNSTSMYVAAATTAASFAPASSAATRTSSANNNNLEQTYSTVANASNGSAPVTSPPSNGSLTDRTPTTTTTVATAVRLSQTATNATTISAVVTYTAAPTATSSSFSAAATKTSAVDSASQTPSSPTTQRLASTSRSSSPAV